jgi:hypothetical protein
MRSSSAKLLTVLMMGIALSNAACTSASTCSRGTDASEVMFDESMVVGNVYRSAPIGGPYTPFPGGRTITFDLDKHLGAGPNDEALYTVQFWLAFSPNGTLAPSSGNMTELVPDPDPAPDAGATQYAQNAKNIRVYNDTCSDFYIQVVAQAPICDGSICDQSDAGAGGASDANDAAGGASP